MTPAYGVAPPGYRLPPGTRVGAVRLQISDLQRSLSYYRDVLGFGLVTATDGAARLVPHGTQTPLIELVEQPSARRVPHGGLLGLYHFAILLPSRQALGQFVRHLTMHRVRFASADHFVSEALYLWDPDGLGIEVYADRPREAWSVGGRELVMTTEPLDVGALATVAGAAPWTGMPSGTTLGHVHLSVGDLPAARAFYHAGLGLDQTVWSYPGALFLSAGGYHHHLGLNTWSAGARAATDEDARLLDWALVLPDAEEVDCAAASLNASGYAVIEAAADRLVPDPWGTALRLTTEAPGT